MTVDTQDSDVVRCRPKIENSKERWILLIACANSSFSISLWAVYSSITHFRGVARARGSKSATDLFKHASKSRKYSFSSIAKAI